MDLFEFEAKQEFKKYSIPTPNGTLINDKSQTALAIAQLKRPYMVKAQVLVGGRWKAGGILTAKSAKETEKAATKLLGTKIRGLPVFQVLIEEKLASIREIYVGIIIDRNNRCYVVLASQNGGVDIEDVADKAPKAILRIPIDSQSDYSVAVKIAEELGYVGSQKIELANIIQKVYRICLANDAELVEINPLAETQTGFVALDARMVIDDNALFRHPEYAKRGTQQLSPQESIAKEHHLAYVELDGEIGVVGNGAGLVMATLDLLTIFGGKPADFLDLGGGATVEAITAALEIVLANPKTSVVLVNVLGGITHCDDVARGIVSVMNLAEVKKPFVVRLVGTNQHEGRRILTEAGVIILDSMEEAAEKAVEIAKGAEKRWA